MSIRSSEKFTFAGETSDSYGILNVNMSSGMQSEPFSGGRSIREQKVKGNDRPYFMGIEREALDFTVSFAFQNTWDDAAIRSVARWLLNPKYFSPLIFAEDTDRIFYCICIDSPELIHTCLKSGYINLHFRCADHYTYTSVYVRNYDLSTNPTAGTVITFENIGDAENKPLVEITKIGTGDANIFNQSNGNAEMTFTGLASGEVLLVDCENRIITTSVALTSRYGNLVGDYLTLPINNSYLLVKGNCKLKFTYQLKRLQ